MRKRGPWLPTAPASARRKLTFVVEEAAIHQDEPALIPLLNPGAGLQEKWGIDRIVCDLGLGRWVCAVERVLHSL